MAHHTVSVADRLEIATRHHRSADQAFFTTLATAPKPALQDPAFLGGMYNFCQIVQHTTNLAALRVPNVGVPLHHWQHVHLMCRHVDNFVQFERAFITLGAEGMMELEDFSNLGSMKKRMPGRMFAALEALTEGYQNSLGAWAASEWMLTDWMASMYVIFKAKLIEHENGRVVAKLVQDVMETLQSEGPVIRGIPPAIEQWDIIWSLQYELIREYPK